MRPLAFEIRATATVPSSTPAAAAVTATLPAAPAAIRAGLAKASLAFTEEAAASRLSWKAASAATSVLATASGAPAPTRILPRVRVGATAATAYSKAAPVTAKDWPASAVVGARPVTPLAFEVSARLTVPPIVPATLVETATAPLAEARMLPGETRVRPALAEEARTSRLSWKAASVTTVLVKARESDWPRRTLPIASVPPASVARARS